ncbi:MAG: dihydrodipicolinate synthase family protein [Synergistaceae bacterium]|jgi:4-hydroxy-2-oxoglutarate aldolase|nr:dihydrodipicolinate synthase family protein [Synergistaceae bacterium]
MVLEGIYAPIPTPFDAASGDILPGAMEENVTRWAVTTLDGLVVCGSNGELPFVSMDERASLVRAAKNAVARAKSGMNIIAGTFMNATRDAIECCKVCEGAGADAALMLPPHYFKASGMVGARKFFEDVANASPIPVVLYNMPANTGVNIDAATIKQLSAHPNIIGVKDTSGDMTQMGYIANDHHENFSVFCGSGNYFLPALSLGASGGTLAVANLYPESARFLLQAYVRGENEEARKLQYRLMSASDLLTRQYGVPGIKAAMDRAGLYGGPCRAPMGDLPDDAKRKLFESLDATGLEEYEKWRLG